MASEIEDRRYLIPIWALERSLIEKFRFYTITRLNTSYTKKYAGTAGTIPPVVRQLLASDLGLKRWKTLSQYPEEKSVWIDYKVPFGKFIILMGITQLSKNPKVSKVTIAMGPYGAVIIGLHELDELYAALPMFRILDASPKELDQIPNLEYLKMTGFFSSPYIFEEDRVVHISVESPEGNKSGDKLMLNGFIAERPGIEIA